MPFCGNCGTKIEPGERFCGNCGANIQQQMSQPVVYQAQSTERNPVNNGVVYPQTPEHNDLAMGVAVTSGAPVVVAKGRKKAVALIVVAVVLIAAAVLLIFLPGMLASPEQKMKQRSQEFFDHIVAMDLRGMLACVDPSQAQLVLNSYDELTKLAGGENPMMQLLSRSFLQMAMGEAFDPTSVEKITIEAFDTNYKKGDRYADVKAMVNIWFKNAQTAKTQMEYQMVEYDNDWYIAT